MANVQPVMEGRVYCIYGKDNCADRLMKHIREKLTFWVPKVLHKQKGKKQTLHLLFFSVLSLVLHDKLSVFVPKP